MLSVIDGARTIDHTNMVMDLDLADRTAGTVNATSVDMSEHGELLAICQAQVIDAATNLILYVQESNEAAANFVNITTPTAASATFETGDDDEQRVISVDWDHPDRLRYARLVGVVAGADSALYGATTLRVAARRNDGTVGDDTTVVRGAAA